MAFESARFADSPDDLEAIAWIGASALEPMPDARGGPVFSSFEIGFSTPVERATAAMADKRCIVGEFDGVVFGYAVYTVEPLDTGAKLGRLFDFAVYPDAKSVGIGEAMMDLIVADLIERGCVGVDAWALPGDRATKNFFETFGLKARLLTAHRAF